METVPGREPTEDPSGEPLREEEVTEGDRIDEGDLRESEGLPGDDKAPTPTPDQHPTGQDTPQEVQEGTQPVEEEEATGPAEGSNGED